MNPSTTPPAAEHGAKSTEFNAQTQWLRAAIAAGESVGTRRSSVLGQMICCQGCCCGRPDRGFPPLPVDWIKERWKSLKLNSVIQLTISGCLGPCDVANVVCIVTARGEMVWLGGLSEHVHYEQLLDWAYLSQQKQTLMALPASLEKHRFQRFQSVFADGQTTVLLEGVTTC